MIMLVSYLFYGWANPKWIALMLGSKVHYSGIKHDGDDLPYLEPVPFPGLSAAK